MFTLEAVQEIVLSKGFRISYRKYATKNIQNM